jgi:hypothetical protein
MAQLAYAFILMTANVQCSSEASSPFLVTGRYLTQLSNYLLYHTSISKTLDLKVVPEGFISELSKESCTIDVFGT